MESSIPWGKSREGYSHHLAHHCADVAACFEAIAHLPVIRHRMEHSAGRLLTDADISRLAAIAFLHDCGKLHPGFQAKGSLAGISWPQLTLHGHVQEGAAIFDGVQNGALADALNIKALQSWGLTPGLLFAAIAHHGRPFSVERKARLGWEQVLQPGYTPLSAARQLGALMQAWFPLAFTVGGPPLPERADFQHLFCGLVSLADWLGSTQALFPFIGQCDPIYMDRARQQAILAVTGIGLDVRRWRDAIEGKARFEVLSGGHIPRPAQIETGKWSLDDPLVILEAETGSGKTEAALWRFAQLFEAGKVDSLYFALPTRAAARQIHKRVNDALQRLMGEDAPEAVQAVPGYRIHSGEVSGKRLPAFEVLWDDDPDEARRIGRWAAESGRRYLAATVAVGTVDQAMLAALQVKHAHLRAAALSRSLLVIDEIHASDAYMTHIQTQLLKMHLERGGHAMLMSATLGAEGRVAWLGTDRKSKIVPAFETAIAVPYPAVWGRRGGLRAVNRTEQRSKEVAMTLVAGWSGEIAAHRAVEAALQGAKVLVIRNTVRAVQDTFEAVLAMGAGSLLMHVADGPALHHSRFAAEDRSLLDLHVERLLSHDVKVREKEGAIIVGSQTLEQSLDIDADLLITDLCPVDVLLQRIGRLHRHVLDRPAGFEVPQCLVLTPEGGLERLAKPAFENGLGQFRDGGGVYRNLHACELTRRLLLDHPTWAIPEMNRFLVESATHPERIDALNAELGKLWDDYWTKTYGREIAEAQSAKHLLLPVNCDFMSLPLFADVEEKVRTRLGAEGARIEFAEPVTSPFGQKISGINLPSHWQGVFSEEPVEPLVLDGAITFRIDDAAFRYVRTGLVREA